MTSPLTTRRQSESGFSLPELLIATAVMLIISATATSSLVEMTHSQQNIWNRTEMHSGVRSATELLQQEIGQAGRVALPKSLKLQSAIATGASAAAPVTASATPIPTTGTATATVSGMFVNELLTVGAGSTEETVTVTAVSTANNTFTASFTSAHAANEPIRALGGFQTGIVPTNVTDGSTVSKLKMFGDINDDGSMVYVEYTCDTAAGKLYRNSMAFDTLPANKPSVATAMVLLSNIQPNPNMTGCFTYDQKTLTLTVNGVTSSYTFVIDVAITLTVETQNVDTITKEKQQETKALLNVAPRNVFNVWELASDGVVARMQPTPSTVTALLP
jgi:prepilin-type N-terminal cleavage/methylation domain-containing protein